jgi:hypothetical protein
MSKLQLPVDPSPTPRINYRFLQWSAKEGVASSVLEMVGKFIEEAQSQSVPLELLGFDLVDDAFLPVSETINSDGIDGRALYIIATVSSPPLDAMLLQMDMEQAGHLRDSGPNQVFSHRVNWPTNLAPGPSDLLIVVESGSYVVSLLMQRRLITPFKLEEIKSGS